MRTSTVLTALVATLCVVNADQGPVTRALSQSASQGSSSNDTAALEALQKYLGNDTKLENLSPEETKKLLEKLNDDAKSDTSLKAILTSLKLDAQTIAKYTEKTFASIGSTLSTFFSGSIKPVQADGSKDSDEGVFSSVWNSLFGSKKKKETAATTKPSAAGSSSGSGAADVGAGDDSSSGSSTAIEELQASSSAEDTSIQTSTPSTTKPATTKPTASSSRAKLLTSLPIAGAVAAIVVINFL